jgi:uncharacterized protein YjbI with pentapeptide repeats
MFQSKQSPEYTYLDEQRSELNSVMYSVIKEATLHKAYIPNASFSHIYSNKQSRLNLGHADFDKAILQNNHINRSKPNHSKTDMKKQDLRQRQNIWNSRVLRNGAREQRWFDKLQEYRNGV